MSKSQAAVVAPQHLTFEQRAADLARAIAAADDDHSRTVAQLDSAKRAANAAHAAATAQLQADHASEHERIGVGLGLALQAALRPLVVAHRKEPTRANAELLAAVVGEAGAKSLRLLGAPLRADIHLLIAFAEAAIAERPEALGSLGAQSAITETCLEPAHRAVKALESGDPGSAVRALEGLEAALAVAAKAPPGDGPESRDRLEGLARAASQAQVAKALESVSARHALARRARDSTELEARRMDIARVRKGEDLGWAQSAVEAARRMPAHIFGPLGPP